MLKIIMHIVIIFIIVTIFESGVLYEIYVGFCETSHHHYVSTNTVPVHADVYNV